MFSIYIYNTININIYNILDGIENGEKRGDKMSFAKVSKADPYGNFNFRVDIISSKLGNIQCGFNTVTGIGVTAELKEYREGGNNGIPDKLIESISASPVTFGRGMTRNDAIYDLVSMYFQSVGGVYGSFKNRFDIRVDVMNRTNDKVVKSFTLIDCVIEGLLLGDLNSMSSEYMIEGFTAQYNALHKTV